MSESKPKPLFFIVLTIAVIGLLAYGFRGTLFPKGDPDNPGDVTITKDELNPGSVEADDANVPTTVSEYTYVAREKLPPVKEKSDYEPLQARTVKFALNVWAGWAPIILQNGGAAPGKLWTTPDGEPFKVELILIDDPVSMRDTYAAGRTHIGWATLDMLPLFMGELSKDARFHPRVFQQVDWSNGGDGIVVRRSHAKDPAHPTISDLKGKKIVLAQNSPSEYFVLNALVNGGLQPSEVQFIYTQDAFQAAAAFNADKSIAACVSWAPDIYNLSEVESNHLLVSTATANKLIADVWFARADFARDHPDICEGLVRGIFDGMASLKEEAGRKQASELMAAIYGIPADECLAMMGDAHSTNYAENREFFMNQNNPANFERTWNTAYLLYRKMGKVGTPVPFDKVMDFSIIQKLGNEEPYKSSKNEYQIRFAPQSVQTLKAEGSEILTKVVTIHFFPNSWDLGKTVTRKVNGKDVEELYDPNVDFVLDEVAKLASQYGAANIIVEGHTDSSMKGRVSAQLVKELSGNRANAVKEALVTKFPDLDPNQFTADGVGWERPADENDANNHAKNRRVEIKVIALENPE
ncbi:MAG: phosphate ABC transporter substrate-binding/OmpA family protein [Verrucomicrobia bacterium]|nr:phosphate ABC transporter substrate-binding/OmpA family protein [Verrucomicrobiota bacterium]MDA1006419.1 phosphate ABC transporter substrate-binding/OmpA family protein [Verrucomicrobiota bacterium]